MFVVIFQAKLGELDADYSTTAATLRELVFSQFGCIDFISMAEGENEITLFYLPDEDSIRKWKAHANHIRAQKIGRKNGMRRIRSR